MFHPILPAKPPRRQPVGFTLLEVMLGLSLFVIAGLGVMEVIGLINQNATANRALTAARLLVAAKISKAQTDTYTPSNGVVPLSCTAPLAANAPYANQDTAATDPFDTSANTDGNWNVNHSITIIGSTDTGPVITGTMNQTVTTFEAASRTLLITYTLNFTYRGKNYSVTQSTIRAPDQI